MVNVMSYTANQYPLAPFPGRPGFLVASVGDSGVAPFNLIDTVKGTTRPFCANETVTGLLYSWVVQEATNEIHALSFNYHAKGSPPVLQRVNLKTEKISKPQKIDFMLHQIDVLPASSD